MPSERPAPPSAADRSVGLAATSLALSAVAYCGLTLFTAVPGILMGHRAVRRAQEEPDRFGGTRMAVAGLILGYLHVLLFCAGAAFLMYRTATSPARTGDPRASCQTHLKQLGIVMKMYASESRSRYPTLASVPGKLSFRASELYPEYLNDPNVLNCPSTGVHYNYPASPMSAIDDQSYFYLGYVFTSDAEIAAFAAAYPKRLAHGKTFDEDFRAPEGCGSAGSNMFYRLKEGVELVLSPPTWSGPGMPQDAAASAAFQASIPVMIERRGHHQPPGSHVLYMDGHVEFVMLGRWPVTEETMCALERMDYLSDLTPLEVETLYGGGESRE